MTTSEPTVPVPAETAVALAPAPESIVVEPPVKPPFTVDVLKTQADDLARSMRAVDNLQGQIDKHDKEAKDALTKLRGSKIAQENPEVAALISSLDNVEAFRQAHAETVKIVEAKEAAFKAQIVEAADALIAVVNDGKTVLRGTDGKVAINIQTTYKARLWDAVRAYNYCKDNEALSRYLLHTVDEKAFQEDVRSGKIVLPDDYKSVYQYEPVNTVRITRDSLLTILVS